jgi:hypothetical protein
MPAATLQSILMQSPRPRNDQRHTLARHQPFNQPHRLQVLQKQHRVAEAAGESSIASLLLFHELVGQITGRVTCQRHEPR